MKQELKSKSIRIRLGLARARNLVRSQYERIHEWRYPFPLGCMQVGQRLAIFPRHERLFPLTSVAVEDHGKSSFDERDSPLRRMETL
jgi:hypothetical protein